MLSVWLTAQRKKKKKHNLHQDNSHSTVQQRLCFQFSQLNSTTVKKTLKWTCRTSFFFLAESGMLWWTCLKRSFRASSVYCWAGDWYCSWEPEPRTAVLFRGNALRWAGELLAASSSRSSWGRRGQVRLAVYFKWNNFASQRAQWHKMTLPQNIQHTVTVAKSYSLFFLLKCSFSVYKHFWVVIYFSIHWVCNLWCLCKVSLL